MRPPERGIRRPRPPAPPREWGAAIGWILATATPVAALYLLPYLVHGGHYPVGWDAVAYVWRANAGSVDGSEVGGFQAGTTALTAVLMRSTGQNALTVVAVLPAVLAGIAATAAAVLVRVMTGARLAWLPAFGLVTWVAFGHNGAILHLDTVLNSACTLAALATTMVLVDRGNGVAATAVLLFGAAVAEWPFYLFAVAVLLVGILMWSRDRSRSLGASRAPGSAPEAGKTPTFPRSPAGRAVAAVVVSGLLIALILPVLMRAERTGPQFGSHGLQDLLRSHFLVAIGDAWRYPGLVLGALGAVALARLGRGSARLFLLLAGVWVGATIAAGVAQAFGTPVAGARLIEYLFPITVLAGIALWWAGTRRLPGASARPPAWRVALVAAFLIPLGWATTAASVAREPLVDWRANNQIATAGEYLRRNAPDRLVLFIIEPGPVTGRGRRWFAVKATLPPREIAQATRYYGTLRSYLAGKASRETDSTRRQAFAPVTALHAMHPVVVLSAAYAPVSFRHAGRSGARTVGQGVAVLEGPSTGPLVREPAPRAATDPASVALLSLLLLSIAFVVGGGWSAALLPPDPALRVGLAPALGVATLTAATVVWVQAGGTMDGAGGAGPVLMTAACGWGVAFLLRGRSGRHDGALPDRARGRTVG
ncbi:MAG TPA: hypothetical protein VGA30_09110 [Actinomycetota bacterium]